MGATGVAALVDSGGEALEPGQLTAAEWRDLDNWDFWQELVWTEGGEHYQAPEAWDHHDLRRVSVDLREGSAPVVDAQVRLFDADDTLLWTSRSDIDGRAELFADIGGELSPTPFTLRVRAGEVEAVQRYVDPPEDEAVEVQVLSDGDAEVPGLSRALDLMFVVDTTGSMGDELAWLQAELADVLRRVSAAAPDVRVRLSVNLYRDDGDRYLVRSNPFTDDLDEALASFEGEAAGGGGDWPEAVEAGLLDGVQEHDWREQADARLLFLVADAPPHNTDVVKDTLHEVVEDANKAGIRLIPVGASGVDRDTELLFRTLAVETAGTYVFLTDHSGIGDPHLMPIVGDVEVELLNDLLVRVISEAVAVPVD